MMNDPCLEFSVCVCIFCFGVCFNALLINCIWCFLGFFFFFPEEDHLDQDLDLEMIKLSSKFVRYLFV